MNENILTAIAVLGTRINELELDNTIKDHTIERLKREVELLRAENKALAERVMVDGEKPVEAE